MIAISRTCIVALCAASPVTAVLLRGGGELIMGSNACESDADCTLEGEQASRCCPTDSYADGCPKASEIDQASPTKPCTVAFSSAHCTCAKPQSCTEGKDFWPMKDRHSGKKQWLIIGDSISIGMNVAMNMGVKPAVSPLVALDIQQVHSAGNALNVWRGSQCLDEWLGTDPSRWDLISFNFGLHDLSYSNERIEADMYGKMLGDIAVRIAKKAPQAKLLFATTTPVPLGSMNPCNTTAGAPPTGGCPPRKTEDPPVYNKIALKALDATGLNITVIDLYGMVTRQCGKEYEDCHDFGLPQNVHYTTHGFATIAQTFQGAAARLLGAIVPT